MENPSPSSAQRGTPPLARHHRSPFPKTPPVTAIVVKPRPATPAAHTETERPLGPSSDNIFALMREECPAWSHLIAELELELKRDPSQDVGDLVRSIWHYRRENGEPRRLGMHPRLDEVVADRVWRRYSCPGFKTKHASASVTGIVLAAQRARNSQRLGR